MDPIIKLIAVLCFGVLFGTAAIHKARNRAVFRDQLAAYGLVPERLLGTVAAALPIFELTLAAGLFIPALTIKALWGSVFLLVGYALAMTLALLRGRSNIDCGCGGANGATPISTPLVLRNLVLAALATGAAFFSGGRALSVLDLGLATLVATAACVLYLAANQLMANGPNLKIFRNA